MSFTWPNVLVSKESFTKITEKEIIKKGRKNSSNTYMTASWNIIQTNLSFAACKPESKEKGK